VPIILEGQYEIFKIFLTETTLFSVEFVLVIKTHNGIFICMLQSAVHGTLQHWWFDILLYLALV
jgi:hypothetical protein